MFDNKDKKKGPVSRPVDSGTTVISQGILIDGNSFKGVGTVRIDGVYIGEMFVDGHIIVGQTGEVKGNIMSNSLLVAGTVEGNIITKEETHFADTAKIEGDIQTATIIVDQGADIKGNLITCKKQLNDAVNPASLVKSKPDSTLNKADLEKKK